MVDFPEHNAESLEAWNVNSDLWDQVQGDDGNYWQRELVFPATMELLEPLPGSVLEIACGNGNFARTLARRGVSVTATDGSSAQLELARKRSEGLRINWIRVDATDRAALAALADAADTTFGAVVCNMALMDIAEITPLFDMLPLALELGAPFIFSILHPAFNLGPDVRLFAERLETSDGQLVEQRGVRITGYLDVGVQHGIAVAGQPSQQPYFHRPLQDLLSAAFERGWVLDGIREPAMTDGGEGDAYDRLSWEHLPSIPPVLVARLRHRG